MYTTGRARPSIRKRKAQETMHLDNTVGAAVVQAEAQGAQKESDTVNFVLKAVKRMKKEDVYQKPTIECQRCGYHNRLGIEFCECCGIRLAPVEEKKVKKKKR